MFETEENRIDPLSKNTEQVEMILNLIDKLPVFLDLTPRDKRRIAELDHVFIRFKKDELIIREMARGNAFFVLVRGSVRVTKNEQPKKTIVRLKAGTIFGEMAYLTGQMRSTNVIADDDEVVVMQLDEHTLKRLNIEIRERLKDKLIEVLAARINRMNDHFLRIVLS